MNESSQVPNKIEKDQIMETFDNSFEKLIQLERNMLYPALPKPCDRTWLHEYAMLHTSIMNGEMSFENTKYVIVRPHERAGLGNRIRAIHGAFAFAVLTQRAILFDFHERLNDTEIAYLEPPLLHLFEDYKINWHLPTSNNGWPYHWSPYLNEGENVRQLKNNKQTDVDGKKEEIINKIGTGRGRIKILRKDGVKPFYNNLELFFKEATIDDLKPDIKCVVFDSQVKIKIL